MNMNLIQNQAQQTQSKCSYELILNDLYEQDCLSDLKQQIEAFYGVPLNRSSHQSELVFICQNGNKKVNPEEKRSCQNLHKMEAELCKFHIKFQQELRACQPTYRLCSLNLVHNHNCINESNEKFLNKRRHLLVFTDSIDKILGALHMINKQGFSKPTVIENILIYQGRMKENFILRGGNSQQKQSFEIKIKKKLDTLTHECRNNLVMNQYVNFLNNYWVSIVSQYEKNVGFPVVQTEKNSNNLSKVNNKHKNNKRKSKLKKKSIISMSTIESQEQILENSRRKKRISFYQGQNSNQSKRRRKLSSKQQENAHRTQKKSETYQTLPNSQIDFSQIDPRVFNYTPLISQESSMINQAIKMQQNYKVSAMLTRYGSEIQSRLISNVSQMEIQEIYEPENNGKPKKPENKKQEKHRLLVL